MSEMLQVLDELDAIKRRLDRLSADRTNVVEMWLTKRQLAERLGVSVRWLEDRMADGMPHREIAGKRVFRLAAVESWLQRRGLLKEVA